MNEEIMIPKSYHDKVCEEIIRFKDKQFYDAVHLLDDGTLEIHVTNYKMVKRVLVEDDNNFGNLFYEDEADRPQGEWIPCDKELPALMTDVLGTDEHGHIRHVYRATRHGKSRFETVEEGMGINILAWMPLPKPWKGADDEQ